MNTNTNTMNEVSTDELDQVDGGFTIGCNTIFVAGGAIAGGIAGAGIGAGVGAAWGMLWAEALC